MIGFNADYLFDRTPARVEGLWCIDSETSEEVLIDLRTGTIVARRINGKIVDPGENKCSS